MDEIRILIAGGGTGGHLFPAIAIGEKIQHQYPDAIIHYMGSLFGIESKVLPVKALPHTLLPIKGLQRNLSFHSLIKNITLPYYYYKSTMMAQNYINQFFPQVVVGTGGYASAIPVKFALKNNIPVVLQEQNSYPGLTTRLYANKAHMVCIAFEQAQHYLNSECLLTGNPIRSDVLCGSKKNGMLQFQFSESFDTLFVFGGSQGSMVLNRLMEQSIQQLKKSNIQILWQTGVRHFNRYKQFDSEFIRIVPFIDGMADAYAISDLVVSRSGALAVSELISVGKPSILIPFPSAAENHQFKNAESLSTNEAATILNEKNLNASVLINTIKALLRDKSKLKSMGMKAKAMSKPNATQHIADQIIKLALA
jgi:UDP-N-acetylglucosamine--N-acetylmuramyl-(pentapeptide) pyrophosphoryl-undecaprenol N-acetylglucosamine transferase